MTPQENIANQIRPLLTTIGRFDAEYFSVHKCTAGNFKIIAKSEKFFDRCMTKLRTEINEVESGLTTNKLMIYDGYGGIDFVVALAAKIYEIDAEVSTCTILAKDLVAECMKNGIAETDDFRLQKTLNGFSVTKLSSVSFIARNPETMVEYLIDFLLATNDAKNSVDGLYVKKSDTTIELKGTPAYLWKPYSDISIYELAVCIPYIHVVPILTIPEDNACNRHFELIK